MFPLFFWLPDSYPTARSPVTAVFAGLLTKVGVYAIVRTQTLLFPGGHSTLLLYVAALTMIVGVLGAIAQNDVKRILSFHIVSQIGYMVFGIAIGGPAAIAATIFFLIHQIPVKTSLFLVEGMIEHSIGTSRLDRLGGLAHRSGFLAAAVPAARHSACPAFPPFSGFVAQARSGHCRPRRRPGRRSAAVAIVGSLLTLVSMTKIWLAAFWGEPAGADRRQPSVPLPARRPLAGRAPMTVATVALVAVGLAVAVAAGPLYALCERAAADLVDSRRLRRRRCSAP